MQLNRCPVCHARLSLDALVQDEAGRELMGLLVKLDTDTGAALVNYLGLFRSPQRDLANSKALKLARDVLALAPWPPVAEAMRVTCENIGGKGGKPLSNHNYLKKVLDDLLLKGYDPVETLPRRISPPAKSKTAQALQAIEEFIYE